MRIMNMRMSFRTILPSFELGWKRVRSVCAESDCDSKQPAQAGSSGRTGVQIGEKWFCSPLCFARGVRATLATIASGYVVEMPRQPRLSLGLALLSRGYVSEDQLRSATLLARNSGMLLESILLEREWVNEKQLAVARSVQWGHPALGIDPFDKVVEVNLPTFLLRAHSAAPIHFSAEGNRLVLGFVHRVEHTLLQSIEQITGCRPEPCFITPTEFNQQIRGFRSFPGYEEVVSDHPADATQIAASLADFALQIPGSEARIARCKSWVWVRIAGSRDTVDAIFATKSASQGAEARFSPIAPKVTEALG
jgi:hypothetical protein